MQSSTLAFPAPHCCCRLYSASIVYVGVDAPARGSVELLVRLPKASIAPNGAASEDGTLSIWVLVFGTPIVVGTDLAAPTHREATIRWIQTHQLIGWGITPDTRLKVGEVALNLRMLYLYDVIWWVVTMLYVILYDVCHDR